ncbi:tRNA pseudouridine synthase [Thraustotheca clavata]|uniref:tRNA pseudouridine synthase n=1 Tax=Thraustotheca clavata TaxID=74557 RepID=A0A1V9ZZI6_9STRA|nr:tRNA pseudouridine synthase [Thraustotheca clavata]
MAGKRGKPRVHWYEKKQAKKARKEAGEEEIKKDEGEEYDRRSHFPTTIHPGSYAAKLDPNDTTDKCGTGPKRRYGLLLAYCGREYSGMQMNIGVKTIEAELERALYEAGAIARCNYGMIQKIGWNRAARTDKGVHAAGQLVCAKLCIEEDEAKFREKLNALLPEDIRVLEIVQVTKNFNAKNSCDRRTYEYLTPTFVFQPKNAPATTASNDDAWGAHGNEAFQNLEVDPVAWQKQKEYRLDDATYEKIQNTLALYEGTHNFHNFTSKLPPYSPKCNRYIMSFKADKPFLINGCEWIRLRVIGQSFLLHHIRKMIGTMIDIIRGATPIETISKAFEQTKMDLPKAPSAGLYLAKAHFDVYNDKNENHRPSLEFDEPEQLTRIEAFKESQIYPEIMEKEEQHAIFPLWLLQLDVLPFSYATMAYDDWKIKKEEEAKNKGQRPESDDEQEQDDE